MYQNTEPLITVVVPTYNRASTIKRAIESVLNQTYNNWELIIVDDGSTDGTEKVMQLYLSDKRITYCPIKNAGASHARNYGIKMAHGEYISCLDSDDEYEPNRLEQQFNLMQSHGADFSMSCRKVVKEGVITIDEPVEGWLSVTDISKGSIGLSTSLFMFHKSIKEKMSFTEGLASLQDFDFLLRAIKTGSVRLLGEHLTIIHKSANIQRISTNFCRVASGRRQILHRVKDGVYSLTKEEARQFRTNLSFSAGFYSFLCGDVQAARELLKQFQSESHVSLGKKIIAHLFYILTFIPFAPSVSTKIIMFCWKNNFGFLKKSYLKFGR